MDVDACPSAVHGASKAALAGELEWALDELLREIGNEVKTTTLRLHSRLAEFKRNPRHLTVLHVTVQVIDQDATEYVFREIAERVKAKVARGLEFAMYHFEKTRRILRHERQ